MHCSQAHQFMNDHLSHELTEDARAALSEHLQTCPSCSRLYEELSSLVRLAPQLEKIMPTDQLWLKIKQELPAAGETKSWLAQIRLNKLPQLVPLRLATGFVVAVVLFLMVALGQDLFRKNSEQGRLSSQRDHIAAALEHFVAAERHYRFAVEALNQAIQTEENVLTPELASVFQHNIALIDRSIQACRDTIRHHPENLEARSYLLICYNQKVDLLQEMRQLTLQSG